LRNEPKKAAIMTRSIAKGALEKGDEGRVSKRSARGYLAWCKLGRETEEVRCRGKEI